jgi:hypothetical protein
MPKKHAMNCKVATAVIYDLKILINPDHILTKNSFLLTTYIFLVQVCEVVSESNYIIIYMLNWVQEKLSRWQCSRRDIDVIRSQCRYLHLHTYTRTYNLTVIGQFLSSVK